MFLELLRTLMLFVMLITPWMWKYEAGGHRRSLRLAWNC
jgi:hypothetical protein